MSNPFNMGMAAKAPRDPVKLQAILRGLPTANLLFDIADFETENPNSISNQTQPEISSSKSPRFVRGFETSFCTVTVKQSVHRRQQSVGCRGKGEESFTQGKIQDLESKLPDFMKGSDVGKFAYRLYTQSSREIKGGTHKLVTLMVFSSYDICWKERR